MLSKESETIEFKRSTSEINEAIKSICAILNKHKRGKLYFGISDKGIILGQQIGKDTLRYISQKIATSIEPKIYPKISEEIIECKNCILVEFKGENVPYFAYGRAYIRTADEDKVMSAKELEKFILNKNKDKIRWDNQICDNATLDDIDEERVLKFKERYEEINKITLKGSDKDVLKSLGCLKVIKENFQITNAGILLFSKNPEKFFPMNYITIARYSGISHGNEYLDIKDFYGNLFDLVDNADRYIRENVKEKSIVIEEKLPRKVIPQYPYYAIREIIMNAVIHRDYSNFGSRIIIRIFKDRIEFNSPGGLPENVTPKNIVYEQYSRNSLIVEAFGKIKYIEKMGEGWDKIMYAFKNALPYNLLFFSIKICSLTSIFICEIAILFNVSNLFDWVKPSLIKCAFMLSKLDKQISCDILAKSLILPFLSLFLSRHSFAVMPNNAIFKTSASSA
jgi:ATP-dependent DNA helicase RecG